MKFLLFFLRGTQSKRRRHHAAFALQMQADHDVFECGHVAEYLQVLKGAHDPFRGDFVRRKPVNAFLAAIDLAFGKVVMSRDQVKERGLACAVGTDQGGDFSGLNFKRNIVDRYQAAKFLVHAAHGKQGFVVHGCPSFAAMVFLFWFCHNFQRFITPLVIPSGRKIIMTISNNP